jgi:trigger factor
VKTTLSERDGNTVKLDVEVSSQELQEAFDARLKKLAREVRIPGFRPGKAPMMMIRQRFGDEAIITEAVEDALGEWYASAAQEAEIDPVEQPKIEVGEETPVLGGSLTFTATVTVMPEVELGEYKGLEVPKATVEVADHEVDTQVERLRSESAELRPITDRPVRTRDFVTVDFSAKLDDKPVPGLEASDFVFEVGAGRLFPEIEVQTIGMNVDEERTFDLTIPEDVGGEEVGGKAVDFTVKVKEIKEKELPGLSDKWASEVSEFETLLELRQDIRQKLEASKNYTAEQQYRSLAVQAATDNAVLDLPEVVINEQAQEMIGDFVRSLQAQGGDIREYLAATGTTGQQMLEDFKPQAARNVKTGLVLDAVAKAEGIEANDEDVDAAIAEMAGAARTDAETLKAGLEKNDRIQSVKWQIIREKAADFVVANAVAIAPPEPQVEAAESDEEQAAAPSVEAEPAQPEPETTEGESADVADSEAATGEEA